MWCCFDVKTVVEPKKINKPLPPPLPLPLTAEVKVAEKPVMLMFRIPSDGHTDVKETVDEESSSDDESDCESDDETPDTHTPLDRNVFPSTIMILGALFTLAYVINEHSSM